MTPVLLCTSPWIPPEWVLAHGWLPQRSLMPARRACSGGGCSQAEGLACAICANDQQADAICVASVCDQQRRAVERACLGCERWLVQCPMPRSATAGGLALYRSELERLGAWLAQHGGRKPDRNLQIQLSLSYEETRQQLRQLAGQIDPLAFAARCRAFAWGHPLDEGPAAPPPAGIPILLAGPHLGHEDDWLRSALAALGLRIVADVCDDSEGSLPAPLDRALLCEDPLAAIAAAHHQAFVEDGRVLRLSELARQRAARGVVLLRPAFCDSWAADAAGLAEALGLPQLELIVDEGADPRHGLHTRLEAFAETLHAAMRASGA